MIVSKDEFYIPAFVLKWSAKVNQLFLVKEFFRPALPKLVKEKPSAEIRLQRAL
jgi:hypothetical protein